MRLQCNQCGNDVTPELEFFEFDAYILCFDCVTANQEAAEQGAEHFLEVEVDPPPGPIATDIEGDPRIRMPTDPARLEEARFRVRDTWEQWLEEFRAQLPAIKDAYLSMKQDTKRNFRDYAEGAARLECLACGPLDNPFAHFFTESFLVRLEPASTESAYAGCYAGQKRETLHHVLALPAALDAWDAGRAFDPKTVEELESIEGAAQARFGSPAR